MKLLIACIILSFTLFASNYKPVEYKQTYSLLSSIDKYAIIMGDGQKDVYVFLDPLCKYSRKFMHLATSNEKLLHQYRFHLFLYEIPRLHSEKVIKAIYESDKQLDILKKIMLQDQRFQGTKDKIQIEEIATVAKMLGVFKRPFIVVSQEE